MERGRRGQSTALRNPSTDRPRLDSNHTQRKPPRNSATGPLAPFLRAASRLANSPCPPWSATATSTSTTPLALSSDPFPPPKIVPARLCVSPLRFRVGCVWRGKRRPWQRTRTRRGAHHHRTIGHTELQAARGAKKKAPPAPPLQKERTMCGS